VRCLWVAPAGRHLDFSVAGALDGVRSAEFRTCFTVRGELSKDEQPVTVPCSEPHLAEQVGTEFDPFDDAYIAPVTEYLGGPLPPGYVAEKLDDYCVLVRADGSWSTGSVQ